MTSVTNQSLKKVSGIYVIKNTLNDKLYVGAAKSIGTRWANHRKDLNQGKHHSEYLQRAWNKYGKDAFVFEVLEVLENYYQDAPSREIYWMEKLKACDRSHGYNIIAVARMTEVVAELNLLLGIIRGRFQSYKGWTCPDSTFKPNTQRWRRFKIKSPDGVIHDACNLNRFAREHGLDVAAPLTCFERKEQEPQGLDKSLNLLIKTSHLNAAGLLRGVNGAIEIE